jgi:hypothetical protein
VQVPRWRIDQPRPTTLKVSEPPNVTLGGAPAVYTVVVDNRRGRPQDLVRLDLDVLNSGVKPLEFATVEVARAGSWQPLKQRPGRLTAPFAMPGGYRGVFTFRVAIDRRMGDAAVGQGGWLDAKVLLRHADQATSGPTLSEATRRNRTHVADASPRRTFAGRHRRAGKVHPDHREHHRCRLPADVCARRRRPLPGSGRLHHGLPGTRRDCLDRTLLRPRPRKPGGPPTPQTEGSTERKVLASRIESSSPQQRPLDPW